MPRFEDKAETVRGEQEKKRCPTALLFSFSSSNVSKPENKAETRRGEAEKQRWPKP